MKNILIYGVGLLFSTAQVYAQVAVDISGTGIKVQTSGAYGASVATNSTGSLGPEVEMEGVAVINGEVFVDGVKVPRGKTSYFSKKSGKTYIIQWGKDGNVAVHEK